MATLPFNEEIKFVNPYNFVSMTDTVDRKPVKKGNMTGAIHCELIVKDRLALPDHSDLLDSGYDFYNVNGKYIVPGSSIRGCIRSVFESVTPSCFSVVNANFLSQRKPGPKNSRVPGLLMKQNGRWVIYEAKYRRGKYKFKEYENGRHCDFPREWFNLKEPSKTNETYFYADLDPKGQWISSKAVCSDDDINKLLDIFDSYYEGIKTDAGSAAGTLRDIILGFKSDLHKMLSESDSDLIVPIFYELNGTRLTYLSPAQTGRVAFRETVKTLLRDHAPCNGEKKEYCPACRLFGTLGSNNPIASRVRFSDAVLVNESLNCEETGWLPELSSPKITSTEFYSVNMDCQENGTRTKDVRSWTYDDEGTELRGRKFYLHRKHAILNQDDELRDDEKKRRIKTTTLGEGTTFKFDIFFEQIDDVELKRLLWVLTIGENDFKSNLLHKLGQGRPVGYGSVKIIVTGIEERSIKHNADGTLNYEIKENPFAYYEPFDMIIDETGERLIDFSSRAVEDMCTIARYDLVAGEKVSYPIANDGRNKPNSPAAHQWFSSNRTSGNRTQAATFKYILPVIKSADLTLPAAGYFSTGDDSKSGERSTSSNFHSNSHSNGKKAVLSENTTYQAILTGECRTDKNNNIYCSITIDGKQADTVPKKYLPDNMKNLSAEQLKGRKISVVCKGKTGNFYRYFVKK